MLDFEGALSRTWTLGQLIFGLPRHVISTALLFMTWLTEMGVAPAEPL